MEKPLTSVYKSTIQRDYNLNRDFATPSLLLLPRLMARSSGASPGARVVPSR